MVTRARLVWMASQGLQDQKGIRVIKETLAHGGIKVKMALLAHQVLLDSQVQEGPLETQEKMAQGDPKASLVKKEKLETQVSRSVNTP
ncbi:uncharacterized protein LOC132572871 isoform X2 [Heteronotia binoei]|uniref:uncharacterized protein LOC132572871 isoform X2 n=1 Tax=Heteronotia binoei TaxID=13085 RepID=UPI00292DE12C|nr:uncharacterized protein LOC132572871 isoform X2 [Heteronotia binoei]